MDCACIDRHVVGCRNMRQAFPRRALKRLQPRSEKRQAAQPARDELRRKKIYERPWCLTCAEIHAWLEENLERVYQLRPPPFPPRCLLESTDVHEPLTRARAPGIETILDEANCFALCRAGHDWIHDHPVISEAIGLLKSSRGLT